MKRIKIDDITLIALFAALLTVVQVGLSFLPNIELVSLIIIVSAKLLKKKTFFIIYIFVAVEGLIYGFSTWWFCYLYVWTVLALIVFAFKKNDSPVFWASVGGVFGLLFGVLCSLVYLFILGPEGMLAWIVSGLLFDVVHGIGNFILILVAYKPLMKATEYTLRRFGNL